MPSSTRSSTSARSSGSSVRRASRRLSRMPGVGRRRRFGCLALLRPSGGPQHIQRRAVGDAVQPGPLVVLPAAPAAGGGGARPSQRWSARRPGRRPRCPAAPYSSAAAVGCRHAPAFPGPARSAYRITSFRGSLFTLITPPGSRLCHTKTKAAKFFAAFLPLFDFQPEAAQQRHHVGEAEPRPPAACCRWGRWRSRWPPGNPPSPDRTG